MSAHHFEMNYCIDCGKQIGQGATRCRSCAASAAWQVLGSRRKRSEAMRAALQDPELRHRRSETAKAKWQDPEFHRKMSEAIKAAHVRGSYDGIETRRHISEGVKAAWARGDFDGPETRRKISEAMKKICQDPKVRQKRSDETKARWASGELGSSEHRRKCSVALKAAWQNPETRRKHSEAWQNPETLHKHSDAMRAAWARGDFDKMCQDPARRYKHSEAIRAAWARGDFDGRLVNSPTSIELQVAAALDICGIEHTGQYRPLGYSRIYDEFIPPDILIEVQGDYWHGPKRPETQKRDVEKARWAKENGYHLIVMWEHEINEQGAWALVRERVLPLIGK